MSIHPWAEGEGARPSGCSDEALALFRSEQHDEKPLRFLGGLNLSPISKRVSQLLDLFSHFARFKLPSQVVVSILASFLRLDESSRTVRRPSFSLRCSKRRTASSPPENSLHACFMLPCSNTRPGRAGDPINSNLPSRRQSTDGIMHTKRSKSLFSRPFAQISILRCQNAPCQTEQFVRKAIRLDAGWFLQPLLCGLTSKTEVGIRAPSLLRANLVSSRPPRRLPRIPVVEGMLWR